jgi:phosphoserine phosphatase/adenosyl cobinamide kinase/adenosyl cobinamide phosphate guanylyltransferase
MNIIIFGVSRCGKNYFIERLLESINRKVANTLYYVSGSGTLDKFSKEIYGIPLKNTEEWQKKYLRLLFCDELLKNNNNYKHKIVDGHYCFCKKDNFEVVLTDNERDVYDIFFYLDTPASVIIEQANKDEEKKDVAFMTEEKVNEWKEFEIQSLREIALNYEKEFIVLDNNIEDCIDYFETLLLETRDTLLNSKLIAEHIINKNQKIIDEYKNIILLDCDRTISDNDTTYEFCKTIGIDKHKLKNIFSGERYTLYQFFKVAMLYAREDITMYEKASEDAMEKAIMNVPLMEDIKQNGNKYLTIGVTSGILRIWEKMQEKQCFPYFIAGGSNIKTDKIIVSRAVKYYLVKLLKKKGKHIIAVGDSMVDIDMLKEADEGFVVAQEKINPSVDVYLRSNKTEIKQLIYNKMYYDDIPIKRSLFYEYNFSS